MCTLSLCKSDSESISQSYTVGFHIYIFVFSTKLMWFIKKKKKKSMFQICKLKWGPKSQQRHSSRGVDVGMLTTVDRGVGRRGEGKSYLPRLSAH